MKIIKKIIVTVLLLTLMVTASDLPLLSNTAVAQAAAITISSKSLSLEVGQSKALAIKGTKQKVTWSSNKKTVAVVSGKGKVTAKAAGKAVITASVAGKKLTCAVTVKKATPNPYLKDAPFKAKEVTLGNVNFVIPSEWKFSQQVTDTQFTAVLAPNDALGASSILVSIQYMSPAVDFEAHKKEIVAAYTSDYFKEQLKANLKGLNFKLTDFKQDEMDCNLGKVLKTQFVVDCTMIKLDEYLYDLVVGNYVIEVVTTDASDLDLAAITEYIINSVVIK